jgi:hypothetical protein
MKKQILLASHVEERIARAVQAIAREEGRSVSGLLRYWILEKLQEVLVEHV